MIIEHKILVRDPAGETTSLCIPNFLIDNRKALLTAASQQARVRIEDEYRDTSPNRLPNILHERQRHYERYIAEYLSGPEKLAQSTATTERLWIEENGGAMREQLGDGDAELGTQEISRTIIEIAREEMRRDLLREQESDDQNP